MCSNKKDPNGKISDFFVIENENCCQLLGILSILRRLFWSFWWSNKKINLNRVSFKHTMILFRPNMDECALLNHDPKVLCIVLIVKCSVHSKLNDEISEKFFFDIKLSWWCTLILRNVDNERKISLNPIIFIFMDISFELCRVLY
jgi:hypothetical protein